MSPLTLNSPPTIRELMDDPVFAKMMRTRPRLPDNLTHPSMSQAWHVWILDDDDHWKRGRYFRYDDAYRKMREFLDDHHTVDVAIVSVRFMMPPPIGFVWRPRRNPWCARCRRPSVFTERFSHRALKGAELTFDDPIRCFYCGVRLEALPRYSPS